jgi:hypothetical protein
VLATEPVVIRELGDGLVLRWSTPADADAIAELVAYVFRDREDEPPNTYLSSWVHDLVSGERLLMAPDHCAIVVDTRAGNRPVACTSLIALTWSYDGIPFGVGQPELVGTLPEYRHCGLIRAIFAAVHARSLAEGQLAQAITGIESYYRQFGYEYALELHGGCATSFAAIPPLPAGAAEPYALRPATLDDVPLIQALYEKERAGCLVSTEITADYWRALTAPRTRMRHRPWAAQMIVDAAGQTCGYLLSETTRWGPALFVRAIQTVAGLGLRIVLPSVLRALRDQAQELPVVSSDTPPANAIRFDLGSGHPVYEALGRRMIARTIPPYAWYVRVADLPRFLRHVQPALEQRLAQSVMAGYTGELRIAMAMSGLRLAFVRGRLATVEEWRQPVWDAQVSATFPPLAFLQLLFGHRTLDELSYILPDVGVPGTLPGDEARLLLGALFPKRRSWVLPIR